MPNKENQTKNTEQIQESQEEKLKERIVKSQENAEHKSQKLLPFLNEKAEFHQSRIEAIDAKTATRQVKIEKNEAKIQKLSALADRLEDKNKILKATMGNIPGIKQMIERNEKKIRKIREEKIPNRQNKIEKHKDRISQLSKKRDVISHKLNRVIALNDTIKSFSIGINKERREVFSDALDRFNKSTADCLKDKKNALEERKAVLISTYSMEETSVLDKLKLQNELNDVNEQISVLDNKIHKISQPEKFYSEQSNEVIDAAMNVTENKLNEIADKDEISMPDVAEEVITEAKSLENKEKSEIYQTSENYLKNAEMAVEDDYNMIDGIINNGSKEELLDTQKELSETLSAMQEIVATKYMMPSIKKDTAKEIPKVEAQLAAVNAALEAFISPVEQKKAEHNEKLMEKNNAEVIAEAQKISDGMSEQEKKDFLNQTEGIHMEGISPVNAALNDILTAELIGKTTEKEIIKNNSDGITKINPDFYNSIPKENRHIEIMNTTQAEKVMNKLENAGIMFSAVNKNDGKITVTVDNKDKPAIKDMMRTAFQEMEQESKATWRQLGDAYAEAYEERRIPDNSNRKPFTKTINYDYYKSLPPSNRSISVETAEVGKKIMEQLENRGIQYSAVERKNNSIAITVSKADENAYKTISETAKSERAVQFVNPDFYKSVPKKEQEKKQSAKAVYMSRDSLKREAHRISSNKNQQKPQTRKQSLEQ